MSYDEMINEFERIYQNSKKTSMQNIKDAKYRSYLMKNKHRTNVFFKPRRIKIDHTTNLTSFLLRTAGPFTNSSA